VITAVSLGATYDGSSAYTHNIAAAVPAGALVVCVVAFTKTGTAINPTVSGGGLTWTKDAQFSATGGGFCGEIAVFSAPAPAGLASGTTLTAAGTVDFGMFIGAVYLEGVDTGASRVSGTPPGQVIIGPASAAWASGAESVPDASCGLIGFAYGDTDPASSSPAATWAELFDVHTATVEWDITAIFKEITVSGSNNAQGTWASTPAAYAAAMVAYKAVQPRYGFVNFQDPGVF
jgi:hypothetical protein